MFFAAKDTMEWWSERHRRRIRKQEHQRITQELERRGAPLTSEQVAILDGKQDGD